MASEKPAEKYAKRILIVGPDTSERTELANSLAKQYDCIVFWNIPIVERNFKMLVQSDQSWILCVQHESDVPREILVTEYHWLGRQLPELPEDMGDKKQKPIQAVAQKEDPGTVLCWETLADKFDWPITAVLNEGDILTSEEYASICRIIVPALKRMNIERQFDIAKSYWA